MENAMPKDRHHAPREHQLPVGSTAEAAHAELVAATLPKSFQERHAHAVQRAAARLGLAPDEVHAIIGTTIGEALDPETPEGVRGTKLIWTERHLGELVAQNAPAMQRWVRSSHDALGGIPSDLIRTESGLEAVLDHLGQQCHEHQRV